MGVGVCECECVSVCGHSYGWTVWHIMMKFSTGIDLDDILDEFDGQGHRSQVKVTRSKTWVSWFSRLSARIQNIGLWCDVILLCDVIWRHGMTSHDITTWHHTGTKGQQPAGRKRCSTTLVFVFNGIASQGSYNAWTSRTSSTKHHSVEMVNPEYMWHGTIVYIICTKNELSQMKQKSKTVAVPT